MTLVPSVSVGDRRQLCLVLVVVDEGDDDGFVLGVLLQLWLIWDIESVVEILV